jgi:hypothetical protein
MITLKEQPWASIPQLRFLVGEKRRRAEQVAEFEGALAGIDTHKVVRHVACDSRTVEVFHVFGFGRTADAAKAMAAAVVGPDFFCADNMGCSTRFRPENTVAA